MSILGRPGVARFTTLTVWFPVPVSSLSHITTRLVFFSA